MLTFASHFSLKLLFHVYQVGFVCTMQHSTEHFSKMPALVSRVHTAKFIIDISCHWLTTIRELRYSALSIFSNDIGVGTFSGVLTRTINRAANSLTLHL